MGHRTSCGSLYPRPRWAFQLAKFKEDDDKPVSSLFTAPIPGGSAPPPSKSVVSKAHWGWAHWGRVQPQARAPTFCFALWEPAL